MTRDPVDQDFGKQAPSIVRLAGLPAEVMLELASPSCLELAATLDRIEGRLTEVRSALVDELHAAVHAASPADRSVLLSAKRDCFNGRPLIRRRQATAWEVIAAAAPELVEETCALEQELDRRQEEFTALFAGERRREWDHLLSLLDQASFRRGLTLASPDLVDNLRRHRAGETLSPRRLSRAEETLLRYASRSSLKLSPFSTLTRVGLGMASPAESKRPVTLLDGAAGHCELRRYFWLTLKNLYTLLKRHAPFRRRLAVHRNDTLEQPEPGRFRLIRPFDWELDDESGEIRHFHESVIKIGLEGPLVDELMGSKAAWPSLEGLKLHLEASTGLEPAAVDKAIERLLKAGFLLFEPPWASDDPDPERTLREFLERNLEEDPIAVELARHLRSLEALMAETPTSETLGRIRAGLAATIAACYAVLESGMGLGKLVVTADDRFHEDVFLTTSGGASHFGEIARLSRPSVERALRSVQPLVLFSDLHYTRYEFLLSLRALLARRWPRQERIPFLDVLHESQALWRDHTKSSTAKIQEAAPSLWNPFDLPEIRDLKHLRERVTEKLEASLQPDGLDFAYDLEAAEKAVAEIPPHFRPTFGPCLFMQPAIAGEDLWALNHLLDGTGRFSTRYTKVMPGDLRARYTTHFARRAGYANWTGEAELVDIFCSRADQLNVHAVQTPRVVELPGERLSLPPERRLRVSDLAVCIAGPLPTLVDRHGKNVMPIFLGATSLFPMPTLVKFLAHFSLAEFRLIYPQRPASRRDDTQFFGRIRIGNLIPHRRSWSFSPAEVFPGLDSASDRDLYRRVNTWRRARGIPDQVFASEKLRTNFKLWEIHKPQYVDFTSPSFVPIFRACMQARPERVDLRETLPAPGSFPPGPDGRHWAFEVQLEHIALRAASEPEQLPSEISDVGSRLQMV